VVFRPVICVCFYFCVDFFDGPPVTVQAESLDVVPSAAIAEKLPEGFFDDPKMDAKVDSV